VTDPSGRSRRRFLGCLAGAVGAGALAGCQREERQVEVHTGTAGTPVKSTGEGFESVQKAIDVAEPGDTVSVPPGSYDEKITTTRSGREEAPITITGPASAVLRGNTDEYGIVRINHSHVHLRGLTVEGLVDPERPDQLDAYVPGQLIQTRPPTSSDEYLRNLVVAPHRIGYSRASLIGLERTDGAVIGPTTVTGRAGADYMLGDARSRNGELLYIGTSRTNLGSDWHPWTEPDRTRNVTIQHIDNSAGHAHAEGVDIKEGTRDITVEYMTDRNAGHVGLNEVAATVSFKSHGSTVRWCDISNTPIGVEFAPNQGVEGNDLYGCRIRDFDVSGIIFESPKTTAQEQGRVCGNRVAGFDSPQLSGCPGGVPSSDQIGYSGDLDGSGSG